MRKTSLNSVFELAQRDERVLFIGSDLGPDVLLEMKKKMPSRFFMEGVTEQYIIGMAAGLALEGYIPYVNTIATFLTRRCFEQIATDLCLHKLPVRLIANGGGAVYAPLGPTHLAIEDISIMRSLPNMTIISPCDAVEMKSVMSETLDWPNPIYIRLGKGGDTIITDEKESFKIGKSIIKKPPRDALFISTGIMTQRALLAAIELEKETIQCGVLHLPTIKPLDTKTIISLIRDVKKVITLEENVYSGGFGSSILEICSDEAPEHLHKIIRMAIPDKFSDKYGSQDLLLDYWGLSIKDIFTKMKQALT